MSAERKKRRSIRIRHKHDEGRIPGLREEMISSGIDDLELEKVFNDLSQLEDFTFLRRLSIRGFKRGIGTLERLTSLTDLSLWQLTDLDASWLGRMPHLEDLFCHTVKFKTFELPKSPSNLKALHLDVCKGMHEQLDLSTLSQLESLHLESCGNLRSISDCSHLLELREVWISDVRDINTLEGVAAAPNLESITVQNTPNLSVDDIRWMLDHPKLKDVYPALKAEADAPILKEITRVLAPRFGDDIFE